MAVRILWTRPFGRQRIATLASGRQARLLIDLMEEAKDWDWSDRIDYLPR